MVELLAAVPVHATAEDEAVTVGEGLMATDYTNEKHYPTPWLRAEKAEANRRLMGDDGWHLVRKNIVRTVAIVAELRRREDVMRRDNGSGTSAEPDCG